VKKPFVITDPVNEQAVISIDFDIPITEDFCFSFIHPDGRIVEIPPVFDVSEIVRLEKIKSSYQDRSVGPSVVMFKFFPTDPLVAPIRGEWILVVAAPAGAKFVFGVTHL